MTKYLILLLATFLNVGCRDNYEIVLTKHENGQIRELLILDRPVSDDSTGIKKVYFDNGKLQCSGPVSNGLRNGEWTCFYPDGSIEWKATYKMEVENGEVFCRNANGTWRKFNVVNGIKEGKTIEYNFDSATSQYFFIYGQYSDNLEQGLWSKTDTNGVKLIEMNFVDGDRIGYFTNRYNNGEIRLKGELMKDGSMKNFTFYDETGKQTTRDSYIIERI
jgi:antitoxin component YwqK of YwqJK toxin-antitoxin module